MPRLRNIILLLSDIVVLTLGYMAAFAIVRNGPIELEFVDFFEADYGWLRLGTLLLSLVLGLYFVGLYRNMRVESRRALAETLLLVFGVTFLLQAGLYYSRGPFFMPRGVMLLGSFFAFVMLVVWRSLFTVVLIRIAGFQKILFWGDTSHARTLADHIIRHPEKGFSVAGVVRIEKGTLGEVEFPGGKVLQLGPDLMDRILEIAPERITVSGLLSPQESLAEPLMQCSMKGMNVENLGDLHELLLQRVNLETMTLNQLIFSPVFRLARWKLIWQDVYGRLFAALGILLTWPFMVLTAIAVRWDSPGPALLRQKRVGLNGNIFEILKFRSMYIDADARFGLRRATEEDPRITRVGRFIRVTRLDELPQFFNVLRGDMTFVGPRPEMPVYTERLAKEIPHYPQRWRVKPGITGWAQLHHVPELTLAETRTKLEYDLYYIKNASPLLDFLIMFHTVRTLLYRTGAR